METPNRADGLGAVFNARGRGKKKPAEKVDSVPYAMPETTPDATPESTQDTTPETVPVATRETAPELMPDVRRAVPQEGAQVVELDREDVPEEEELVVRNTAVYLPVPVLDRLRTAAAKRHRTYTDLLIDAFDELSDDQLLAACGHKPRGDGGMPRGRRGAARGQGGVQVQLRLDQEQRGWLDEQVARLGAPSRSAMVASVYDAWLPKS